jgi:hypothetical protein
MSSIHGSVRISRTPDDVFDYIADPTRRPQRQDAVQRTDIERRTAAGRGTRVKETRRVPGRSMTASWEVTDYEPGHRHGLHGVDGPVRSVASPNLHRRSTGSRPGHVRGGKGSPTGSGVEPCSTPSRRDTTWPPVGRGRRRCRSFRGTLPTTHTAATLGRPSRPLGEHHRHPQHTPGDPPPVITLGPVRRSPGTRDRGRRHLDLREQQAYLRPRRQLRCSFVAAPLAADE